MQNRQQKELQRLEEALFEAEWSEEMTYTQPDTEDSTWGYTSAADYDIFNTDDADVDLEEYSEQVHQGSDSSALSVLLTMLSMVGLSAFILLLLKIAGVL